MRLSKLMAHSRYLSGPALALVGLMLASGSAVAQPIEEIVVIAPATITRTPAPGQSIRPTIEDITVTRRVRYGDLDLKKQSDVTVLENRVKEAVQLDCKDLDDIAPVFTRPRVLEHRECIRIATDEAMAQVASVVAAAQK